MGSFEQPITLAASVAFTEGPAADRDGSVYFSEIVGDRILRLDTATGSCTTFRSPSGRANGHVFDAAGRLVHCEGAEFGPGGGRRITRTELVSGSYEVLTDSYGGSRYNSPNDLCLDAQGRIFFTDPRYTNRDGLELDVEGVYRLEPSGDVERILDHKTIGKPNGVAVDQDGTSLYVVDSDPTPGGNRRIWGFDLDERGAARSPRIVFDFAPGRGGDGVELDIDGNLYVAAGINAPRGDHESAAFAAGVYIISPDGELLAMLAAPEDRVTNVAFGGDDGCTLYITAGKGIYETRTSRPGQVTYSWW